MVQWERDPAEPDEAQPWHPWGLALSAGVFGVAVLIAVLVAVLS